MLATLGIKHLHRSFSPTITGGGLPLGTFVFHQAHFHWGSRDSRGSEHSRSRTFFPLEVQLIHFNTKYANVEEALGKRDGIAILATFFQVSYVVAASSILLLLLYVRTNIFSFVTWHLQTYFELIFLVGCWQEPAAEHIFRNGLQQLNRAWEWYRFRRSISPELPIAKEDISILQVVMHYMTHLFATRFNEILDNDVILCQMSKVTLMDCILHTGQGGILLNTG